MLRYFASIRSSSKSRRAPKPIVSPVALPDRPQQPAAEPVVVAALPLRDQTGRDQLGVGELLLPQVLVERVTVARGEAEPKVVAASLSKPRSARNWRAAIASGDAEVAGVERLGELVRLDQPVPRVARRARWLRSVALGVAQLHAGLVGEVLHGLGERQPVVLHQERDDVATLAAAEAVVSTAGADVERGALLVVERTQPLERAAAGGLEGDVLADDLDDVRPLAHQRDVLLADQPCHARSLCRARRQPGAAVTRSQQSAACQVSAEASVRLATWSTTTRSRAGSSAAASKSARKGASSTPGRRRADRLDEVGQHPALPVQDREPVLGPHHQVRRDALEHRDLQRGLLGHHQVGRVADQRPVAERRPGGGRGAVAEAADQPGGQVLQRRETGPAAVVRRPRPRRPGRSSARSASSSTSPARRRGGTTRARSPTPPPGGRGPAAPSRSIRPATTPSSTSCTE